MKADNTVTITPATIEEWEQESVKREKAAAKLLEEAKSYRARAEAGKLLLGLSAGSGGDAGDADDDGPGMMESMATIANAAEKPMTKATMKSRLLTLGFPEDRMTSYFYTCVARLKAKKRITVTDDGKMWKGEAAS
jgi:hypothetical protein